MPLDAGDFCVITRRVADAIRKLPERNVFVRGLRAWVGFRQTSLEYEREARAAGETKYPFGKLCRLAADGVFSFSTIPLRMAAYFGFVAMTFSVVAVAFVMIWRIAGFNFMGTPQRSCQDGPRPSPPFYSSAECNC
jgi:dolichol-phosphate mannosyltransferase